MRVWIDRRKDWARLWDNDPRGNSKARVLATELIHYPSVQRILGSYHGCKRGQCIAIDITAKRAGIGGGG